MFCSSTISFCNLLQKREYIALEVIGGQVVLKFDIGDDVQIVSNPKLVSDGEWHQVIVERAGRGATLTVR